MRENRKIVPGLAGTKKYPAGGILKSRFDPAQGALCPPRAARRWPRRAPARPGARSTRGAPPRYNEMVAGQVWDG